VTSSHVIVPAVVVVGGDTIVGQVLELLLRSSDYVVRFLDELPLNEPRLLDGARLLLLAPGLSIERRKALLELVQNRSVAKSIAILELVTNAQEAPGGAEHLVVPWPCRTETLRRYIDAALLAGSKAGQNGHQDSQTRRKDGAWSG
jgi:hypothetical protein